MHAKDILIDAFGRIQEDVHAAVEGLPRRPSTRVPRRTPTPCRGWYGISPASRTTTSPRPCGLDQVWLTQGWEKRFGLDLPRQDTGYGHSPRKVAEVRVESDELLLGYYDAVHDQTLAFLRGLTAADLDRVVDERWTPAVTLGVRLVSVLADDLQHVGQAAYVRGLLQSAAS